MFRIYSTLCLRVIIVVIESFCSSMVIDATSSISVVTAAIDDPYSDISLLVSIGLAVAFGFVAKCCVV